MNIYISDSRKKHHWTLSPVVAGERVNGMSGVNNAAVLTKWGSRDGRFYRIHSTVA